MRRPLLLSLLALPLLAGAAAAQPAVFAGPGTLLRLSESAEVTRAPDEVTATLRTEVREATPAGAQAAVNRNMAAALEAARAVRGITASTGAYRTWRQEEQGRWMATQTLHLRGPDQAALLELVGALQGRGLALGELGHRLTRDAARTARQEAASLALDSLRRRAEAVAGQMGMKVERIAEIQVDSSDPSPRPMPMLAQSMAARAAPAPTAQADDVVVSANASAAVVMVPN